MWFILAVGRDRVDEGGAEGEVCADVQAAGAAGVAGRPRRHVRHPVRRQAAREGHRLRARIRHHHSRRRH